MTARSLRRPLKIWLAGASVVAAAFLLAVGGTVDAQSPSPSGTENVGSPTVGPSQPASPDASASAVASPITSAEPEVSPAPSEPPKPFSGQTEWFTGLNELLSAVGGAMAALAAAALVALLALILVPRLWELIRRKPELVVPAFINGTGEPVLDALLVGENVRLREFLATQLEHTRRKIKVSRRYTDFPPQVDSDQRKSVTGQLNANAPSVEQTPLPSSKLDPRVDQLAASLSAAAPETVKPLFGLLSFAFPARGSQISATVQRQPGPPDRLGLSVEITQLNEVPGSSPLTIWEDVPKSAAPAAGDVRSPDLTNDVEMRRELARATAALGEAGRYALAVHYARRAAQLDRANAEVGRTVELNESRLSRQIVALAHFEAGARLAATGDRVAAARQHALAFTVVQRRAVERDWKVALGVIRGNVGDAKRDLARRYASTTSRLVAQAIGLLEEANEAGASKDEAQLKQLRQGTARLLAVAALSLMRLGSHDDAASLADEAAALDPDGEEVKSAKAIVDPESPPDTAAERKAAALAQVARVLENHGALLDARAKYEAALAEDPSLVHALEGMARVIAQQRDTSQRLTPILKRAARWAAYSLAQRDWIARVRAGKAGDKQVALIHNYFGMLYQSEGAGGGPQQWLDLAAFELRTAIELDPGFYQAHQNLADTLVLAGRKTEGNAARRLYREAVLHFDQALALLPADDAALAAKRRINITKALALVHIGPDDADVVAAAKAAIKAANVKGWRQTDVKEAGTAYDLACWFARGSAKKLSAASREQAIRQLTIAIALDPAWSHSAANDDDLASVRDVILPMINLLAAKRGAVPSDVPNLLKLADDVSNKLLGKG